MPLAMIGLIHASSHDRVNTCMFTCCAVVTVEDDDDVILVIGEEGHEFEKFCMVTGSERYIYIHVSKSDAVYSECTQILVLMLYNYVLQCGRSAVVT